MRIVIGSPKAEGRRPKETRGSKSEPTAVVAAQDPRESSPFRVSDFGLLSAFDLRPSDFKPDYRQSGKLHSVLAIFSILVSFAGLTGCGRSPVETPQKPAAAVPVQTVVPKRGEIRS